jgi:hypothetical protein
LLFEPFSLTPRFSEGQPRNNDAKNCFSGFLKVNMANS